MAHFGGNNSIVMFQEDMASTYMSEYQRTYKDLNLRKREIAGNRQGPTWQRYLQTSSSSCESPRFEYTPRARTRSPLPVQDDGFCWTSEKFSNSKCTRGNLANPSEIDRDLALAEAANVRIYRDVATETINSTGTQTPGQRFRRRQERETPNFRRKPQSIGFYLK